jgi:hypothetical protein
MTNLQTDWVGWEELPGNGTTDAQLAPALITAGNPAIASNPYVDELVVFAKGIADQGEYINSRALAGNNQNWVGWGQVPPGGTTNASLAASYNSQLSSLLLFAKGGKDNHVYVNICTFTQFSARHWSGWKTVGATFTTNDGIAATNVPNGDSYLFATNSRDGKIWMARIAAPPVAAAGTTWSTVQWPDVAWFEVPGGLLSKHAPAVTVGVGVNYPNSRIFLFCVDQQQRVYFNVLSAATNAWSGWDEVGGNGRTDAAVSATAIQDGIIIFGKGIAVPSISYNAYRISSGIWAGWSQIPGGASTDVSPSGLAIYYPANPGNASDIVVFTNGVNVHKVYWNTTQGARWQ